MYESMVHPLLTFLFDLLLIGTALSVIAAMTIEYLASKEPSVGRPATQTFLVRRPATGRVTQLRTGSRGAVPQLRRRHAYRTS